MSRILRTYEAGEKVCVKIDSSVHRGMPHRRYHGRIAVIKEKRGRAYVIKLKIGSKDKNLIVRPEHIKPMKSD